MLMTRDEANKVVAGCVLAARKKSNGYSGPLAEVEKYNGTYGAGYTVTSGRMTEYWIHMQTMVSQKVFDGDYDVKDVCMTANNMHTVKRFDIAITPCWELTINTITGETWYECVNTVKPATFAGTRLTISWRGTMDAKKLRLRIRRKFYDAVRNKKAILVENDFF